MFLIEKVPGNLYSVELSDTSYSDPPNDFCAYDLGLLWSEHQSFAGDFPQILKTPIAPPDSRLGVNFHV
jgi:hypothetical protein